ncbi:class I SAM-dependent methyltransferase [Ornithinimicrobium cavernae]|uniref:class I SAM-dependent methyltransferase n=1 Tax=Ornithinimicrobium cavernae TaxID=2666047 RepID=UPI00137AA49D|nr:class I SAM-dependent methyltransferase [Ornithinimicrobium cavernae]
MTQQPPAAGTGARLELNSPLSAASAARLVAAATAHAPELIIDHGCGWGTLLLDALASVPTAHGTGIDVHAPDIDRAWATAEQRGLTDRVTFVTGSSEDVRDRADLLISIGAFQALGTIEEALARLAELLRTGGRLLFGSEYWQARPTPEELALMWDGARVEDCLDLPGLIGRVQAAGWRVLDLHDSTRTEFDAFEVGHLREREEWLLEHPGHPVRAELDQDWAAWLRGRRRPMGFVTLLLGR